MTVTEDRSPPAASNSRALSRAVADLTEGFRHRDLWLMLGWQDIRQRYRRSTLGPLWITIATAVTAIALGFLYATLFKQPLAIYLPYVMLGFIFWNLIQGAIVDGSEVFIANEGLIKQIPAPLSVHVYRLVWRHLIFFAHNIVIYIAVVIIWPQYLTWWALLTVPALALIVLNALWCSLVFGVLATRFRDIEPLLNTGVQLLFFITPIIWNADVLRANYDGADSRARLVELNPLFHYLEIARGPLLGHAVPLYHWLIVIGCTVVGWIVALIVLRNYRARVPYWV